MKFYLNNTEVQVEVAPIITETLDETLDSASVVLKANSQRLPYAPMQSFRIDFENDTDVLNFVVVSDSVEVFSLNPLSYKHTLSLVQNTRTLSKHLVRNSSFTQPADKYKSSYWAITYTCETAGQGGTAITGTGGASSYTLSLDTNPAEKILGDTFIEIDYKAVKNGETVIKTFNSIAEIQTYIGGVITPIQEAICTYKLNNVSTSTTISTSDIEGGEFVFNKKLKCNKIKELLEQGATDLYVWVIAYPRESATTDLYMGFIQVKAIAETYYYTAYDILDLLIKRQQQKTTGYQKDALFTLPSANTDLYNLLTNTIAPNFTFTQCTMYECVAEVFRLYDAIFTMDQNGVLGIEYFNDLDNTTVLESAKKLAGLSISISEDRYTNQLLTYYQDARQERVFPSKNSFAFIRSTALGTPESNSDHQFIVDKPIYQVNKCELLVNRVGIPTTSGNIVYYTFDEDFALDITDRVLESSIWTLLDTGNPEGNYLSRVSIVQNNSINYNRGEDIVNCGQFFNTWKGETLSNFDYSCLASFFKFMGISSMTDFVNSHQQAKPTISNSGGYTQWYNTKMRLTYISTFDGRTIVESLNKKSDGTTLINQNNGAVDLSKMGLNMLGVSLKSGEPTLNATTQITTWSNRLKKGVIYQDSSNNKWVVNVASYTLFDNCINAQISFVKNFNALSQRIRLNQEKRLSNVSSELTQKSEDNIVEYVYYSTEATDFSTNYGYITYISYITWVDILKNTFGLSADDREIQYAQVLGQSNCYCPIVKYPAGNCLCLEMAFDSPIVAGNKTTYTNSAYFTSAVKYTHDNGYQKTFSVKFMDTTNAETFTQDFPSLPIIYGYNINDLEVYKQPNEIFALNYETAFIPVDPSRDFIGKAFMENNNLLIAKDNCKKTFYLYYKDDFKYSVLDTKGEGSRVQISTMTFDSWLDKKGIIWTFTLPSEISADSWAICDADGNIYFASNKYLNLSGYSFSIYLVFRKERI